MAGRGVLNHPTEGSYYWLGRRTEPDPLVTVMATTGTWKASNYSKDRGPAVAGRPVRGHRVWVVDDGRARTLWVESLWPGQSFYLNGFGVDVDELYRIVEGIRQS